MQYVGQAITVNPSISTCLLSRFTVANRVQIAMVSGENNKPMSLPNGALAQDLRHSEVEKLQRRGSLEAGME